jgi:hypothetical protein
MGNVSSRHCQRLVASDCFGRHKHHAHTPLTLSHSCVVSLTFIVLFQKGISSGLARSVIVAVVNDKVHIYIYKNDVVTFRLAHFVFSIACDRLAGASHRPTTML